MNLFDFGAIPSANRAVRLSVRANRTTPRRDWWLAELLDGLDARRGSEREHEAFALLGNRIDEALADRALDRVAALLEDLDPRELEDDVALTPIITTVCARLPLRPARTRYAERVRGVLRARGWSDEELSEAIDDLL